MLIKAGQIITLNMQVNNSGTILYSHPYLVMFADEKNNYLEIAQIDSLKGKEFKAARRSNKVIFCDDPQETVIDKDSYIQLDNSLRIEYFDKIVRLRRQEDCLSTAKFQDALTAYKNYQDSHILDENKQVYLTMADLISLNPKLK